MKRSQAGLAALLGFRTVGFLVVQAGIALYMATRDHAAPWTAAAAWWPLAAMLTNVATVGLLITTLRREGLRFADLFSMQRSKVGGDLLLVLLVMVVAGPIGALPGPALGWLLWGDAQAGSRAMMQPLPPWGVWVALIGFPLTIAFAELPLYFGYLMPRLPTSPRVAAAVCATALAAQHMTLPLLLDARFVAWRFGMFLPFALLLGFAVKRRPGILPWLCVVHALIDASAGYIVWQVSNGRPI